MARRPASGRGWTDDGRATGKSFRHPLEAWWKHESENRCAILTIRAQFGLVALSRNWQDMRKKTRFVAPDRVSFDTTHNLKAAGSNPASATKNTKHYQRLQSRALRSAFVVPNSCQHLVNVYRGPLRRGPFACRALPIRRHDHPGTEQSRQLRSMADSFPPVRRRQA